METHEYLEAISVQTIAQNTVDIITVLKIIIIQINQLMLEKLMHI